MKKFEYKRERPKLIVPPYDTCGMRSLKHSNLIGGLTDMILYIINKIGYNINLCEIGSYNGESSILFAMHFDRVVCVDAWKNGYDKSDGASEIHDMKMVEENFDFVTRNFNNIEKIKIQSSDYFENVKPPPFDVIYIDAQHDYESVKRDIELSMPYTKSFLCGHDYGVGVWPGVKRAVDEIFPNKEIKQFHDHSWLIDLRR